MPPAEPVAAERTSGGNASLFQLDVVVDGVSEVDAADRQGHFGRQRLVALETPARHGLPHRLFDLALGGDADGFQKYPNAGVEHVLVHASLPDLAGHGCIYEPRRA